MGVENQDAEKITFRPVKVKVANRDLEPVAFCGRFRKQVEVANCDLKITIRQSSILTDSQSARRTDENSPALERWESFGKLTKSAKRTTEEEKADMSHTYISNLMHCVFSTKERLPLIDSGLELRLWPYVGGIARENRMKALAVGGTADHVHTLLSLPSTMAVAKAVQLIKGGSSKWIHDTFPAYQEFSWQEGYGAFSVSRSQMKKTVA